MKEKCEKLKKVGDVIYEVTEFPGQWVVFRYNEKENNFNDKDKFPHAKERKKIAVFSSEKAAKKFLNSL